MSATTTTTTQENNNQEKTISIDLQEECPKLKEAYNTCFQKWYTDEFLAGKATDNVCFAEWDLYKSCMIVSVTEKGLEVLLDKDFKKEAQEEEWGIKDIRTKRRDDAPQS